jgi:hypothetical protein
MFGDVPFGIDLRAQQARAIKVPGIDRDSFLSASGWQGREDANKSGRSGQRAKDGEH